MFDMGFLPDIRRIISRLPEKRQNLLFAATMPRDLRKLTGQILVDPMVAELAHSKPAETIAHALYPVQQKRKLDLLEHLLKDPSFFSSIVFTRTKHRATRLARQLKNRGLNAIAIQGNMTQGARDRAMKGFRDCRFDVLVATDIVARGIDVEQVSHVINYDVPNTADAYTHRIGRTGRSEREGRAYTFVSEDDLLTIEDIERKLGVAIERRTIEGFEGMRIPLPTRRQRRNSQNSSERRSSRNSGRTRSSRTGSGRRRADDSRFESRRSRKPRQDSGKSEDSRFKNRKSSKPRQGSGKSEDSRFENRKSRKPRQDSGKSEDSRFKNRKSRKPRQGSGKSEDSRFENRKSSKPRQDSGKTEDTRSPSRRSGKSRARSNKDSNLPFAFSWSEDSQAPNSSGDGESSRPKRPRKRPSAEDGSPKKSKTRGKRRRRRNRHRRPNADTSG